MSEMTTKGNTPWHLWVVGILAVLWNAMGAIDYTMTKTKNEAWMGAFPPEQLEYFYNLPAWAVACWAIAVWFGVVGSILLLLKRRSAVWVFFISFIAALMTAVYNYGLSAGYEVMGLFGLIFAIVILVVAFLLYIYARAMRNRAVLL